VKVAVYGDFCLDAYWIVDPHVPEISVETGLQTQALSKQNYSLGGASNIVANLAALEPAQIQAIGVIGDDIFGRELTRQLQALGADTAGLVVEKENFDTVTFCKRYLEGEEQHRIDFGFSNRRSEATEDILIKGLRHALETKDVVIFNQQVPGSLPNESFIEHVNRLFEEYSDKIVLLDSRHYTGKFKNVYRKINQLEAAFLVGMDESPEDNFTPSDLRTFAEYLWKQSSRAVFVTRGANGILVCDQNGLHEIPGLQLLKEVDTVGAGDTTMSALACCLAAGIEPAESGEFANFAAAVTVQKLFRTGTASGSEILEVADNPVYVYQPELAEDIRQAAYYQSSEIEICCNVQTQSLGLIKHAVFDHDGTISTLRQGWEAVMKPMMMRAILGDQYDTASETVYHKVSNRVHEYINRSTGIQTILQMEALVEMVVEFGPSPEKVLDKFGYKEIYNQALMTMVDRRIAKFECGELEAKDLTIKGAVSFLETLRDMGVTLYLASGTDCDDVINEARVLGYADLFNGGIYGALGDVKKYSKKIVFENILRKNKLQGTELACFGDGPVEICKCRDYEGIAVGIASDEIRRFGLNWEKRTRLIKAGAHFIAPDFSQAATLLEILF